MNLIFRSWLKRATAQAAPAPRTRPRPSYRPFLERLEDRTVPSLIATQILPLMEGGQPGVTVGQSTPTPTPLATTTTVKVIAPALTASALTGQTVTLVAAVGGGVTTGGTVSFNLGVFGRVDNVAVVNGVASSTFTIPVGAATPNTFPVTATYSGTSGYSGSASSGAGNGTLYFCQDGASTLLGPTLQSFAVLAGSTVTNTGSTTIFGNVGVTPGSAIVGFPPGIVNGTLHSGPLDAVGAQAQSDLTTAYTTIQAEVGGFTNLTGRDLGGLTLTPGRYHFDNSAQLTGTLTLDDLGNPTARFDFQIGSTLTTASSSRVLFVNGGPDNVYWEVGSSATLGTTTVFAGNILALTDITLNTGASIACGRALARNGAVTMDTNFIDPPAPPPPAQPGILRSDAFGRANASTLGAVWTNNLGGFGVSANRAISNAALSVATLNGVSAADVSLAADLSVTPGGYAGLSARYAPASGSMYWAGVASRGPGVYRAEIWSAVGGVWSLLASSAAPVPASARVRFEALGASLKLFVDDSLQAFTFDGAITGPGLAGIRASGGMTFGNFQAAALAAIPAALPFADAFASGNQLGLSWADRLGNFAVQGGAAVGNAALSVATLSGVSAADVSLAADLSVTPGGYAGLSARYAPASGSMYWAGVASRGPGVYRAEIWSAVGGVWSLLAGSPASVPASARVRFEVLGNSLKLFVDDSLQASAFDSALAGPGLVGIRASQGQRLGNFQAAALAAIPAALPFADAFASGNQLGLSWADRLGNFAVQGGAAVGNAALSVATLSGVSAADVSLAADLSVTPGGYAGLSARYAPASGSMYWAGVASRGPGVYRAEIWSAVGGVWSLLAGSPASVPASARVRFEVLGNSLKLFVDDSLQASAFDSALAGPGLVGIRASQGQRLGNFQAS